MTVGAILITTLLILGALGVVVNFLVVPMLKTQEETQVSRVGATNQTGNVTVLIESAEVGIFGDPDEQLNSLLVILGIGATVGVIGAVLGFVTGGASAGLGAVAGFLAALGAIAVNILLAVQPLFSSIPTLGDAAFIMLTVLVISVFGYAAAGFLAGGGSS